MANEGIKRGPGAPRRESPARVTTVMRTKDDDININTIRARLPDALGIIAKTDSDVISIALREQAKLLTVTKAVSRPRG